MGLIRLCAQIETPGPRALSMQKANATHGSKLAKPTSEPMKARLCRWVVPPYRGSLNLSANPVSRVGKLEFESPVNEGGLRWQNSDARIHVAPELQGALLLQSTQTGIVIDGDVRMRGDFRTEDRLAGQSIWTANQQVISPDGRWTGSSVGLDADTLVADSTDFLRVGDLDDLDPTEPSRM